MFKKTVIFSFSFVLLLACYKNPDTRDVASTTLPVRQQTPAAEIHTAAPAPKSTATPDPTEKSTTVSLEKTDTDRVASPAPIIEVETPSKKSKKLKDDPIAKIQGEKLEELSGIVPALKQGEFWGHNDRGNDPKLHRFNIQGEYLQTVKLLGVENDDWESVTRGLDGSILIGGFGDNDENRDEYHIYQCTEPNRSAKAIRSVRKFAFKYSDAKSHNCEAFFLMKDKIYLITKERDKDDRPILFRMERLNPLSLNTAREIAKMNFEGVVTDAAYSQNHGILAVLTYSGIYFIRAIQESDLLSTPVRYVKADFDQCEGLCFRGDDLIITNESGDLWKYALDDFIHP